MSPILRGGAARLPAFLALVPVLVLGFAPAPGRADEPPPGRTDVLLTTAAPIQADRNALWCATIQLAWDAAADVAGKDGRLEVGPPAPADVVAALNRRSFPHGDLDEASTLVVGGLVAEGVLDRLRTAWREKFPGEDPPAIEAGPEDAIGYAALRKDLPFERPLRVIPEGTSFARGTNRFAAFGLIRYDAAPDVKEIASQVTVWFAKGPDEAYAEGWRPVVELTPRGGGDRILLSALDPGPTLESAWSALADRLATGHARRLDDAEELTIPRVRLDLTHRFEELRGAPLVHPPGGFLREVRQSVRFSLTEKGASLASDALVQPSLSLGARLVFDRPFLLALQRQGAARPYLLLWVGNDELLEPLRAPPGRR